MKKILNLEYNMISNYIESNTIDNELKIIIRTDEQSEPDAVEQNNDMQLKNILILELCKNNNVFKPISVEVFIKMIQALIIEDIKKCRTNDTASINFGALEIRTGSSEVFKDGFKINLSTKEYKLLHLFIENKGMILSNEQIINCVWGIAYANTGMLRVAIRRLRSKIDPDNQYIKTVRGKGYILENL